MNNVFELQKKMFQENPYPDLSTRLNHLMQLRKMILENKDAIFAAITADFGQRSCEETLFFEMIPLLHNIRYLKKHLKSWMKPEKRKVGWLFQGGRAYVQAQPLGVVGIVVPWNYPLLLSLLPAAEALAAGNRVMIKLSEFSSHLAALLSALLKKYIAEDWIFLTGGDVSVAETFSHYPFDHLFFTGSKRIGKKVMQSAAESLTPVTLELGGKSPAIIAQTADLKRTATIIAQGKLINAGQTCVAPDIVFIHESQKEIFILETKIAVKKFFREAQYTSIIAQTHYDRLQQLLTNASMNGAKIIPLIDTSTRLANRVMLPCIVTPVSSAMKIAEEEIFGPLLGLITYQDITEVWNHLSKTASPLVVYYFDKNTDHLRLFENKIHAGALVVNQTLVHAAVPTLPFGGIRESGMGQYHGLDGFQRFSHIKPVFIQHKWNAFSRLGKLAPWMQALAQKWLRFL